MKTVMYLSKEKVAKSGKSYRNVATVSDDGTFNWSNVLVAFQSKSGGYTITDTKAEDTRKKA